MFWDTDTMLFLRRPAGKPLDEAKRKPCPGTFRPVTEENLLDCAVFEDAERYLPVYRSIMKRGHLLRFGYLDGRCVFRYAIQPRGKVLYTGNFGVELGPNEMYIYHIYCLPEARGKGFHPESLWQLTEEFPDAAFYAMVKPGNRSSLRAFYRAGYEPYLTLSGKRRFFLRLGLKKELLTPEEVRDCYRQAGVDPA